MYVPFVTANVERLYKRKGGGGKGKGGGASSSSGGSSEGGSSSGSKVSSPVTGSTGGRHTTATTYGSGGGKSSTIPSGQLFAGRTEGGGTRSQVFGTQTYGSGYPGVASRGVGGLGFPFLFWPVVWGGGLGYGAVYLHDNEYGDPNNSSRPGGPMQQVAFKDSSSNNTFHVLADNTTVLDLIDAVSSNCSVGNTTVLTPTSLNFSDPLSPQPEEAVQYYRASSVVLTLDGYNNTAALSNDSSVPNTPLPPWVDQPYLDCLNQTIGAAVPLADGALPLASLHLHTPSADLYCISLERDHDHDEPAVPRSVLLAVMKAQGFGSPSLSHGSSMIVATLVRLCLPRILAFGKSFTAERGYHAVSEQFEEREGAHEGSTK
ncbi:hypothetical protein BC835DRAFT_1306962 [Cytidiella melzeri]|nr:hypothetical protein BC835DRAFT_1306962 [Cytidiella melzeri]